MTDREIKNKLWDVFTQMKAEHDFTLGALIIKISKRLRSQAGNCLSDNRNDVYTITMSRPLFEEFGWERLEKNFRHELAHAYCNRYIGNCGHNHKFKEICVKFGGSMNERMAGWRYKEASTNEYCQTIKKWEYICPCGLKIQRAKRMSKKIRLGTTHFCRKCKTKVIEWKEVQL